MESEKEKHKTNNQRPSSSFAAESDTTKMVGLVDELEELKERVFEGEYPIISIVGMAGIGKTTLAKELYYNPICCEHFGLQLFFTVGPQYQSRQFVLLALAQLGFPINKMAGKKVSELGECLHSLLLGIRYLIVLDDIWDTQVWQEIKILFPNDKKGSRIIITTRFLNVTGHLSSDMVVPFLNDDESWSLLCRMVFTRDQESSLWDHQLEKIGRKIAKNCEGLPLAIIEVGKLLCKIESTVDSWMEIAEREDPLLITLDDGTPISNTLSLSYKMLPHHLKSCFMYMGVFRKNYEIPTIKLINLWVSEGFITQPSLSNKSLEKVAEGCLDDLVSRSLVLVCKGSSSGKTKTCRIHFVYRNICISEAKNEKLFGIIKKYPNSFPEGQRGLCFHNNSVLGFKQVHNSLLKSDSDPRSLLIFGPQHQHPLRLYLHFPSLRVLDAVTIRFYKFPHQVVELVELRYLTITYDGVIPPSISRLCNLEVLIVRRHHESLLRSSLDAPVYLPMEIWELQKLRHLQCIGYDLPDPTTEDGSDNGSHVVLKNLSTLLGVSAHSCKWGVLERMPNLTKLGIQIQEYFSLYDEIKYLDRLESFKCIVKNPGLGDWYVTNCPYFPVSIRKIALSGCGFPWGRMTDMWNLQKLEVLKLKRYAFCGPEWNISEWRRFMGLKFLLLEDLDIEHWTIDHHQFPNLRRLIIRHCYKLRELPSNIGYISSLEMIEVYNCSPSLVISAQQIQELQQQKNAYKSFQLRIHSSWDDKKRHTTRRSVILFTHNFEKIERKRESKVVMAAAAVESMLENLQQLLFYHAHAISRVRNQVERLERDLRLFKAFLKDSTNKCIKDNSLYEIISQIRDIIYEAEDVIDAFVTQAVSNSRSYFPRALKSPMTLLTITRDVEAVGSKVREIYGVKSRLDFASPTVGDGGSQKIEEFSIVKQDNVVGFEDDARTIIGYLNEETQQLDVISIIGIPGLGKTTLARKIFCDPSIQHKFPTRIWVYISQEFTKKEIFLTILREFTMITEDMYYKSNLDLSRLIASHLEGGKFLIVMDNVWTVEDWDTLQIALPKSNMGKVLITSRNVEVAHFSNQDRRPYKLRFLTQDESWLLLQLEVFGQTGCPYDLEGYGKLIVDKCQCMPLAIVVIGGILVNKYSASDEMSVMMNAWKKVSENVSVYLSDEDPERRTKKIIALSYDELPYHLRACFLYFGIFPEDFEIPVWKLIRMWIAEGFIQHKVGGTLEETAESYLDDLIHRNLVRIDKKNHHGKAKTCRIHNMLREFCKTEGENDRENFLQEIKRSKDGGFEPSISEVQKYRRLCIHSNVLNFISSKPYGPRVRSFACFSKEEITLEPESVSHISDSFKLLRVLEAKPMKLTIVPSNITNWFT